MLTCYISDRVQRLKDARAEADKEIASYKKLKEDEFKAFENSVSPLVTFSGRTTLMSLQRQGTTQSSQAAVDKETEAKLQTITQSYEKNKDQVVKKLLDRVVLVKPELHRNLKKKN